MILSLLYHDVVEPGDFSSSGFPGGDADLYKLLRSDFESHLHQIASMSKGPRVQVLDGAAAPPSSSALLFTFDDGGASALMTADLLEQHGWRGHFFIPTDFIGRPAFLTRDEVRELRRRGHVIGSHSCSHPHRLSHLPQAELDREWSDSVSVLSEILSEKARVASVPGGFYSRRVAEAAARAGIQLLFNSEPTTRLERVRDCFVLGRYCLQQGMSAATAAAIAHGDLSPRLLQFLLWNSKKAAKRLAGPLYYSVRKSLLKGA
jgi:peptidoglycan/xylan/chitin deacetylase (PgdA/CDA1 family)